MKPASLGDHVFLIPATGRAGDRIDAVSERPIEILLRFFASGEIPTPKDQICRTPAGTPHLVSVGMPALLTENPFDCLPLLGCMVADKGVDQQLEWEIHGGVFLDACVSSAGDGLSVNEIPGRWGFR
jgi:hypothetical protein